MKKKQLELLNKTLNAIDKHKSEFNEYDKSIIRKFIDLTEQVMDIEEEHEN